MQNDNEAWRGTSRWHFIWRTPPIRLFGAPQRCAELYPKRGAMLLRPSFGTPPARFFNQCQGRRPHQVRGGGLETDFLEWKTPRKGSSKSARHSAGILSKISTSLIQVPHWYTQFAAFLPGCLFEAKNPEPHRPKTCPARALIDEINRRETISCCFLPTNAFLQSRSQGIQKESLQAETGNQTLALSGSPPSCFMPFSADYAYQQQLFPSFRRP